MKRGCARFGRVCGANTIFCAPAQVSAEFAKQTQLNGVLLRKTLFNLHSVRQNSVVFRSFLLFFNYTYFILNNSMWYIQYERAKGCCISRCGLSEGADENLWKQSRML